ncbi:hypothetical protein HYQ46_009872 [Verticillium longisporum]|nr:hypothetical protein HYQ46_009872 [Verticillium longisporum]
MYSLPKRRSVFAAAKPTGKAASAQGDGIEYDYTRRTGTPFAKGLEEFVWRYPLDATPAVVHGRGRRGVTLALLAKAIEKNACNDKEEHEAECDSQTYQHNEDKGHLAALVAEEVLVLGEEFADRSDTIAVVGGQGIRYKAGAVEDGGRGCAEIADTDGAGQHQNFVRFKRVGALMGRSDSEDLEAVDDRSWQQRLASTVPFGSVVLHKID